MEEPKRKKEKKQNQKKIIQMKSLLLSQEYDINGNNDLSIHWLCMDIIKMKEKSMY